MNLFSQGLFSQFVHFWGYDVLYLLTLIQPSSIFSLIVCIYKTYVSDEQCFSLSNHCYDNWKTALFLFPWQPLLGIQVLSSNHAAYESKLFLKELSQTNKVFPRKIVTKVYIASHYQGYKHQSQKCIKNYFFEFLPLLVIT